LDNINGAGQPPSSKPRPILIVEDDESIANAIEWCLSEEGYSAVIARDGHEALALVDQCNPCLILLDMKMPGMDGWTFAAAYRQLPTGHAPIIVMTAAEDSHSRAAEVAAEDHIAKPFNIEHLLTVIRQRVLQDSRVR